MMYQFLEILNDPQAYDHEASTIQKLETHISWVFLAGNYAYKLKKPVNFGFLDFSDLEKRKKYCQLELRYNQDLAGDLYLEVVAITKKGIVALNAIEDESVVLEYAVKMRKFVSNNQFDNLQRDGQLTSSLMESLAKVVAQFHMNNKPVTAGTYGTAAAVLEPCLENFRQIEAPDKDCQELLINIERWTEKQGEQLEEIFSQRKQSGYIKACHGDMHLRNIALYRGQVVIFDCIEFNEAFRIIDVMSELAFVIMDLQDHDEPELASHLLNCYLQITGDFSGLQVLSFYLVYRSMVRAKVDFLRLQQVEDQQERQNVLNEFSSYLQLATSYTHRPKAVLYIMHGLSGSGKSYVAAGLADCLPAIRIRSDVERKRLAAKSNEDIYSLENRNKIYHYLAMLSEQIIQAGYSVIVDATFLLSEQRKVFRQVAEERDLPILILHCAAATNILQERITKRKQIVDNVSDASISVLQAQLESQQALTADEIVITYTVNTDTDIDFKSIQKELTRRV